MEEAPATDGESWGWTRPQRAGLGILLAILLTFLLIQYLRRPARLDDPVVTYNGEAITLPRRVDPNTATAAELTRIPHLAEALAGKIIDYREKRKRLTEDGIVFREPADLSKIPGLGKATVEQLRPYLEFPEDAAETQPATGP